MIYVEQHERGLQRFQIYLSGLELIANLTGDLRTKPTYETWNDQITCGNQAQQ